jgi:hypothetical protein
MCAMAYGDVPAAARLHPLGPPAFVAAVALTAMALVVAVRGGRVEVEVPAPARRALIAGLLAALAVSWALKWLWLGP